MQHPVVADIFWDHPKSLFLKDSQYGCRDINFIFPSWQQLWTVYSFSALNTNVAQCSETSHSPPVNILWVLLHTIFAVHPATCFHHSAAHLCSIQASFIPATCSEACIHSDFYSYLLHAVILTKPHNFVPGTITDNEVCITIYKIRTVNCLLLYY
jgi:hypothetical protein